VRPPSPCPRTCPPAAGVHGATWAAEHEDSTPWLTVTSEEPRPTLCHRTMVCECRGAIRRRWWAEEGCPPRGRNTRAPALLPVRGERLRGALAAICSLPDWAVPSLPPAPSAGSCVYLHVKCDSHVMQCISNELKNTKIFYLKMSEF